MRTQFTQPAELDSLQLVKELAAAGIIADLPNIDHDNKFWLNIDEKDIWGQNKEHQDRLLVATVRDLQ